MVSCAVRQAYFIFDFENIWLQIDFDNHLQCRLRASTHVPSPRVHLSIINLWNFDSGVKITMLSDNRICIEVIDFFLFF